MDMTANRRRAVRPEVVAVASATVSRSRVKPAPRDAAEAGTRDRRTGTHTPKNLRGSSLFPQGPRSPRLPASSRDPRSGARIEAGYDLARHAPEEGLQAFSADGAGGAGAACADRDRHPG